jgi:hypothetical protein
MADITITVTISDVDQNCMKNDLVSIDGWVQNAVAGKINNCWKRFRQSYTTELMEDTSFTDAIPSNKEDFVNLVLSRPGYKDRVARDLEIDQVS